MVRTFLRFLRRCWTGEDMTLATQTGGFVLFVAIVWLIETIASNALRAVGMVDPAATIGGWVVAGTYVVLGGAHDVRARRRREARLLERGVTRLMVGAMGLEHYARGSGRVIDADLDMHGERRQLWRVDDKHGEPLLTALEVVNSSPDPDGSRRVYFIRVPPRIRSCRDAVAWTFGLDARHYAPSVET